MTAWTCDAHDVTTTSDCWMCDDELAELADRSDERVANACCHQPMHRPAEDACRSPLHRTSDATLGLREANCQCCYVVDMTALDALRSLALPLGSTAGSDSS